MDEYVESLESFEICCRIGQKKEMSKEEFAKFQSEQVQSWSPAEKKKICEMISLLKPKLDSLVLDTLPALVILVLTTGLEESHAAYCRGKNAIFFPRKMADTEKVQELAELFAHELMHVISRNMSSDKRDELYSIIGFKPLGGRLEFPEELVKITNPDSTFTEHFISVQMGKKEEQTLNVVPLMVGNTPEYVSGGLFEHIQLVFLPVERDEKEGKWKCVRRPPEENDDFFDDQEDEDEGDHVHGEHCNHEHEEHQHVHGENCNHEHEEDHGHHHAHQHQHVHGENCNHEHEKDHGHHHEEEGHVHGEHCNHDHGNDEEEEEGDGLELLILPPNMPPSFWKQVGTNTNYIHAPEEILAENFSLLLTALPNDERVQSPEIISNMASFFGKKN